MDVKLRGEAIKDSPFHPSVVSAATHGPSCTTENKAITDDWQRKLPNTGWPNGERVDRTAERTTAGNLADFIIQANDRFGNRREGRGDSFDVQLVGAAVLSFVVFEPDPDPDLGEGCFKNAPEASICYLSTGPGSELGGWYQARYRPTISGKYNITLALSGGEYFQSSPLLSLVSPGSPVADNCIAFGQGLNYGVSRKPATFTIQARDLYGNNAISGGASFTVNIRGEEYIYDCKSDEIYDETYLQGRAISKCTHIQDLGTGFYVTTWWPVYVVSMPTSMPTSMS